jgi:probable F420-dependent oxidoreductase
MRFMYVYPEMGGTEHDMLDAGPIGEVAATAESAGFGGFAFTEHPSPGARWLEAGGHQSLDPFVALAFVAAATTEMKLLTYLSVLPYRNPLLLAKTTATLDRLSGGRFILGVGAGYLRGEFKALGVDFEERNALFDEALDVLPMHWSGEPFSYKGTHFEATECIGRPKPVQQPIPIWIGGNAKIVRRRVAERVQGWMPLMIAPEYAATTRSPVLDGLDDLQRKIEEIRAEAGDRTIDVVYSTSGGDVLDDPARHRDDFAELEARGVTWIMASHHTRTHADTTRFLEAFGETYLP